MKAYMGIDVGGTKTLALLAGEDGKVIGRGQAGAGNHESVGYAGLQATLVQSTELAMASAGIEREQIVGAGFGVAGFDWPSELPATLEAIAGLELDCPVTAVNDTVIGLVAGAEDGWGVAIVAGTGCNCWGRDRQGRQGRVTGDGGRFGEYGGAGEIVGKALHAVAYEHFRRGPATQLTPLFVQACGAKDAADLLEGIVLEWYSLEASLAPKIFELAHAGDVAARDVIDWAGQELGGMAVGVIHQLEIEKQAFEVVLVGSVWEGGPLIREPMQRTVLEAAPQARFTRLAAPPVTGALLLGMEAAGLDARNPAVRQTLMATAGSR